MNDVENSFKSRLDHARSILPADLQHPSVMASIQLALSEDLTQDADTAFLQENPACGDITSQATLDADSTLVGHIRAKAQGVLAGLPVAAAVFSLVDLKMDFASLAHDGDSLQPGMRMADVSGPGRSLLAGERTALNFLGRMSGIASLTRRYVDAVAGTRATILDTRKTAPGLRRIDKYAVRMGGGQNHRTGLFDMVLIKDNHIRGAGGITTAVEQVRIAYGERFPIEVEVKDLDELEEALRLRVDRIMLDNMSPETMRIAVEITKRQVPLEASGNVSLENVRQIADTGVDFISSGALTHSAPTLDISMKIG